MTTQHIADLKPDTKNARKHTPRNIGMIATSLQEVGAARSIVIDEDNNILAGNRCPGYFGHPRRRTPV